MNAEIIAVGSELLLGQIANTNAQFLSSQLATIGVNVYYHTVVGDNNERLQNAIETAKSRVDTIIFTGGLGPTEDDLTKEGVCLNLGTKLEIHEQSLQTILQYFTRTKRDMPENNRKQALVIENSDVFINEFGMAPGMCYMAEGKTYILLPGPPSELIPMVRNKVVPYLLAKTVKREKIASTILRFYGIGESYIEEELQDLFSTSQNPTLAPLAGDDEVIVRITGKHADDEVLSSMLQKAEDEVLKRIGSNFYAKGETSLPKELFTLLESNNYTIASAESFTGGWFLKELTSFKGASQVVKGGFVTYTNEMKNLLLDIPNSVLENDGAVSEKCAKLMAESARKKTGAHFGISFTGNAGPTADEQKPVGMVYIGISPYYGETKVYSLNLNGSRDRVRHRGLLSACFYMLKDFLNKEQSKELK